MQIWCLCSSQLGQRKWKVVLFPVLPLQTLVGHPPPLLDYSTNLFNNRVFARHGPGYDFRCQTYFEKPEPPLTISPGEPGGELSLFITSPVFLSYMLCSNNLVLLSVSLADCTGILKKHIYNDVIWFMFLPKA